MHAGLRPGTSASEAWALADHLAAFMRVCFTLRNALGCSGLMQWASISPADHVSQAAHVAGCLNRMMSILHAGR